MIEEYISINAKKYISINMNRNKALSLKRVGINVFKEDKQKRLMTMIK